MAESEQKINPKTLPGDLAALKAFVQKTGNPGWTDNKGYGLLHACAIYHAQDSCDFLLETQDPNMQDTDGLTPLAYAATENATNVMQSLISHGAKVDLACNDMDIYLRPAHLYTSGGKTPLHWACERGCPEAVALLLSHNADPTLVDLSGASALDYAIFGGSRECFDLLNNDSIEWPETKIRKDLQMDHLKITRNRIEGAKQGPAKMKLSKIIGKYQPKHPRVYKMDEEWMFSEDLMSILRAMKLQNEIQRGSKVLTPNGEVGVCIESESKTGKWTVQVNEKMENYDESQLDLLEKMDVLNDLCNEVSPGIWTFPCLNPEFCECLLEEVEHIEVEAQRLFIELHRPNSMNRYGMVLNEVGFQDLLHALMDGLVSPLSNVLLPTDCNCPYSFRSDYSFIIRYKQGEDLKLETHVDSSDITLNVCLGKEFTGGRLYFHDVKGADTDKIPNGSENCKFQMDHLIGQAVLHRGNVIHGADRLLTGERCNLIMWCRV